MHQEGKRLLWRVLVERHPGDAENRLGIGRPSLPQLLFRQLKLQGEYFHRTEDGQLAFDTTGANIAGDYRSGQAGWTVLGTIRCEHLIAIDQQRKTDPRYRSGLPLPAGSYTAEAFISGHDALALRLRLL